MLVIDVNSGRANRCFLTVENSSFIGNNVGLGLARGRGFATIVLPKITGSIIESNAEYGVQTGRLIDLQEISNNRIQFNGVGLATQTEIEAGIIHDNDFESNNTHLHDQSSDVRTVVVANDNYWGVETTALLAAGNGPSAIPAFRGTIQIDSWAESSRLTELAPPPSPIEWERAEVIVTEGELAGFRLTLDNIATFEFQWFKDGVELAEDGPVLTFESVALSDAGTYTVVVSNAAGSVTSAPSVLTVLPLGGGGAGPGSFHPADTNQDFRIGIDEVTRYGAAWKRGQVWEVGPNPIPIDYLTRAGALWKNGERYRRDPTVASAPLWWVSDTQE